MAALIASTGAPAVALSQTQTSTQAAAEEKAQPAAQPAPPAQPSLKDQKPAAPAEVTKPKKPFEQGFTLADGDRFSLRLRANLQADGRFFVADDKQRFTDSIFLRRVRPWVDGAVYKFATFKIMPDFGQGKVELQDAYVDLEAHPALRLRVGKTKANFGLERLQSQTDLELIERSQVTGLIPNRDVGAQLHGLLANGALHYSAGIWNGVPDGASGDLDGDSRKDYIGRLFVKPFRFFGVDLLNEVGFGFAASHGIHRGTTKATQLPSYKSPNQQSVIVFNADAALSNNGTAVANGAVDRFSPQAAIYIGPVGVMAEYVHVSEDLKQGNDQGTVIHDGWEVTGSFVLTGEKARFTGVDVASPASLDALEVGALELVLRYDTTNYSKAAFGRFIDSSKSYTRVDGYYAGLNWYLNNNVKLTGNFVHSELKDGPASLPSKEDALVFQTQLTF